MNTLLAISSNIINFFKQVGKDGTTAITDPIMKAPDAFKWLGDLLNGINTFLYPLLIVVIAAGAIYAIVLGVNLVRAETSEKREEAKKRMIWAIVGVVSIFVLILVLDIVMNNIHNIIGGDVSEKYASWLTGAPGGK